MFKNIPFGGNRRLQLRWEIYNVSTVHSLPGRRGCLLRPADNQVNTRFGQVITTRTPRAMQIAVRFVFWQQ